MEQVYLKTFKLIEEQEKLIQGMKNIFEVDLFIDEDEED